MNRFFITTMISFLFLSFLFGSNISFASGIGGIYHNFNIDPSLCPGQEIFKTRGSFDRFNERFVELLSADELNADPFDNCTMAFTTNFSSFFRSLIIDGDKENYEAYLIALDDLYQKYKSEEVASGIVCRADSDSSEETQYCKSDQVIQIFQLGFRIWFEFFKKSFNDQLTKQEALLVGGYVSSTFAGGALLFRSVRANTVRFLTNTFKHFLKTLRSTGRSLVTKVSPRGTTASRSTNLVRTALSGQRGFTTGRTAAAGTSGGTVGVASASKAQDQVEILRTTDDFGMPFNYLSIEQDISLNQWVKSYIPCLRSQDLHQSRDFSYRKTICQNMSELAFALAGGILPAYFAQTWLYNMAIKGPLLALGGLQVLKKSGSQSIKQVVRIAKGPFIPIILGLGAAFTIGKGINDYGLSVVYNNTMTELSGTVKKLKQDLSSDEKDINNIETYFLAQNMMNYSESFALYKTAPLVDQLEKIQTSGISASICLPLGMEHAQGVDASLMDREFESALLFSKEKIHETFYSSKNSGSDGTATIKFDNESVPMFIDGFESLVSTQNFINSHLNYPSYLDLKSPVYNTLEYLNTFKSPETFYHQTQFKMKIHFENAKYHAQRLRNFVTAWGQTEMFDKSSIDLQTWRDFFDSQIYFENIRKSVEIGGQTLNCHFEMFKDFFLMNPVYERFTPCELAEEYPLRTGHCRL